MAAPSTWFTFIKSVLRQSLYITPIVLTVNEAVVTAHRVHGGSMQPTLQQGDIVLVNKFAGLCLKPAFCTTCPPRLYRGDVVTLWSPSNPHEMLVKRLIAMQGDWLHVDGQADSVRLKKGICWVEGDSRGHDSREFGACPAALMQGRVFAIVWPLHRARLVHSEPAKGRIVKTDDPLLLQYPS